MGAGLLAKAIPLPPSLLSGPPLSRAGSLPQGFCDGHKISVPHRSTVGASLLAIAPSTAPHVPRSCR
ncbi:hypothetical protein FGE05_03960 [Pseudomonas sp. ICMP22404]|nr:hypothetical protein FGE05_03960 [Pseudomonas sp. ICMP22404]